MKKLGFFVLIGRGSDHSVATSIFLIGFGIVLMILAIAPGTRARGALSYGKGPSAPINRIERVLLALIALVMEIFGFRWLF